MIFFFFIIIGMSIQTKFLIITTYWNVEHEGPFTGLPIISQEESCGVNENFHSQVTVLMESFLNTRKWHKYISRSIIHLGNEVWSKKWSCNVKLCPSFKTVILEKPIRIPRSLSVKAASVLKGFLNKVRFALFVGWLVWFGLVWFGLRIWVFIQLSTFPFSED